jgi:hypothetical protein
MATVSISRHRSETRERASNVSKVMQRSTARFGSRTKPKAVAYSGRQRQTSLQSSTSTRCFRPAGTVVRFAKQRPKLGDGVVPLGALVQEQASGDRRTTFADVPGQ